MKKLKKLILIPCLSLILVLPGCGLFERVDAGLTGSSTLCVDGVEYLQFTSGASVAYNTDGTIKTCN